MHAYPSMLFVAKYAILSSLELIELITDQKMSKKPIGAKQLNRLHITVMRARVLLSLKMDLKGLMTQFTKFIADWNTEVMVCVFQFPVVAVDQWCPVTNPFTHMQHGHVRVLLAMGIEQQVSGIFSNN